MKDIDFHKIHEFIYVKGGLIPYNDVAQELLQQTKEGAVIAFDKEVTARDLKFHQCYFSLLNYIWAYLPNRFKAKVACNDFYKFIKHLKKEYKVVFEFADGTQQIEYDSISFGRMSQKGFEEYIKEQLPYIYVGVIKPFFEGKQYDNIIENIEWEFRKFLNKL